MKTETGFERFQIVMAEFSAVYLKPAVAAKSKKEELSRSTDKSFSTVFYGFTEISSSLDALALSGELIGLAPPRSQRIKKDEYLKFLISAYLQETYILEQRLKTYAKQALRMYGRGRNKSSASENIQSLLKAIEVTFDGVTRTRGDHVHDRRYTDKKLDLLFGLVFISQFKPEFADDVHFEFRKVQHEWKKTIRSNNLETQKFVDYYFDVIYQVVTREGEITLPRTGRGQHPHEHSSDGPERLDK